MPAQAADILHTELSLWLDQPGENADAIKATATLDIVVDQPTDHLLLRARDLLITGIRKVEGRLKESYSFRHFNDSLWIDGLRLAKGERIILHFDYYILPAINYGQNYLFEPDQYIVLNPENMNKQNPASGVAGNFYPSLPADESSLRVDLSLPEAYRSHFPGELEFQTDNQDGSHSHYWQSKKPVKPEEFYLMAGTFEQLNAQSIDQYLAERKEEQTAVRAEQLEKHLGSALDYLDLSGTLSNLEFIRLDSLSRQPLPGFYLQPEDVQRTPYAFQLEKAAFLWHHQLDTSRASQDHLHYYRQICGLPWMKDLLDREWHRFHDQPLIHQQTTLSFNETVWHRSNAWSAGFDSLRLHRQFWQKMQQSLEPPFLHLEYTYNFSENQQKVLYKQDTSLAPVYHLAVEILLVRQGDSSFSHFWIDKPVGVISLPSEVIPEFIEVNLGDYFPGMVMEQRPETQYLYQLRHTDDPTEKRRALHVLLDTENPNLFSTILGIALDDPYPGMRADALNRVDQLNDLGKRKLRQTLLELSKNDPDSANRQLAEAIVEKLYGSK